LWNIDQDIINQRLEEAIRACRDTAGYFPYAENPADGKPLDSAVATRVHQGARRCSMKWTFYNWRKLSSWSCEGAPVVQDKRRTRDTADRTDR